MRPALALLLVLAACHSSPKASPAPDAAPPAPSAAPSAAPKEDERLGVVRAWNDALSKHDLDLLGKIYGAHVKLYGKDLTREACVAQKREAFAKTPSYRQTLEKIQLADEGDHARARFVKISQSLGKARAYDAYLVLAKEDGAWRVVEESDKTTDTNLSRSCEDAVMAAALATKRAKAFLDAPVPPEARDAGFLSRGGMLMPFDTGDKRYTVALHDNFEDRIVNQVFIEVDPKTGDVYVDDAKVATDAAVPRACK
jgi:hypothetical protein